MFHTAPPVTATKTVAVTTARMAGILFFYPPWEVTIYISEVQTKMVPGIS